ncbi:leucyl aminopeptidase family protein [Thiotrichales bacterium 19S3-7]|nr:leucyl aminopeptidase family protein [Thiotrichales bacterium 19S3-7]MCF6801248.1 leucyl aminopeptidase family protein [Thiotrichales bacterium 19S3-11]
MINDIFFDELTMPFIKVIPVDNHNLSAVKSLVSEAQWQYIQALQFIPSAKSFIQLPDAKGELEYVLWGVDGLSQLEFLGYLSRLLPEGYYKLEDEFNLISSLDLVYLGYALGRYQFVSYHTARKSKQVKLYCTNEEVDDLVLKQIEAVYLVRNLINTPANDLGPSELASTAEAIAARYHAKFECITADELLIENYPLIHAVGRAAKTPPRLVKFSWGNEDNPHIALVGKGVCYDTGGLSLKPTAGMKLMKKDMGGAAQVLGLAQLIMSYQLPVRLTVYLPIVENSIGGDAYRLGDIIKARNGKSVEILNTDAEGRLILADALAAASETDAELIIDFATLTGACRVALGMDIGAVYSNNNAVAREIEASSEAVEDLLWHMPLYGYYKNGLKGRVAELTNVSSSPYAGSIVAALFLEEFVDSKPWVHMDISGWRDTDQAISEIGGDAIGLRAVFAYLASRFS